MESRRPSWRRMRRLNLVLEEGKKLTWLNSGAAGTPGGVMAWARAGGQNLGSVGGAGVL